MRLLNAIRCQAPEKIALCDETRSIPYGRLALEVEERILALRGVSVLAIALDNSVEWLLWDLAAMQAGIPCVPVPPFFTSSQISHLLPSAGVSHLVSSEGLRDTGTGKDGLLAKGTAKVTFTSGTTGTPKGVCLPVSAMENVAESIATMLGKDYAGNHACVLPLAVLLENVAGVYAGLMAGCTIHLTGLNSFGQNYAQLHGILKKTRANSAILVPEILRILMMQVASEGPLPDLRFVAVGGSKVDPALIIRARQIGLPVYEGYGLSECASVVALNVPGSDKPGTVGKLLPHVSAEVIDNEICIKNPGFLGYINESAPESFATGDLGQFSPDGFVSVTGRRKNILITSYGRNISPEWVESALLTHPCIAQAVVYGDAQPALSALIVPSAPDNKTAADVAVAIATANNSLPDYARIHAFRLVPPFTVAEGTLTGTGRPRREKILTLYTQENEHELLQSAG